MLWVSCIKCATTDSPLWAGVPARISSKPVHEPTAGINKYYSRVKERLDHDLGDEMRRVLFEKIDDHVVHAEENKPSLLYIDLHLVHEVTSPQVEALRLANRKVRRPDLTFAAWITTRTNRHLPIADETAGFRWNTGSQLSGFRNNLIDLDNPHHGIVH